MARPIDKANGQAVIELTVVVAVILFIVCAVVATTAAIKKEIKHNFVGRENASLASVSDNFNLYIENQLKDKARFFPKLKNEEILEQLESEGWSQDRRLKVPEGLIVMLSLGEKHMDLIKTKTGNVGVFH